MIMALQEEFSPRAQGGASKSGYVQTHAAVAHFYRSPSSPPPSSPRRNRRRIPNHLISPHDHLTIRFMFVTSRNPASVSSKRGGLLGCVHRSEFAALQDASDAGLKTRLKLLVTCLQFHEHVVTHRHRRPR